MNSRARRAGVGALALRVWLVAVAIAVAFGGVGCGGKAAPRPTLDEAQAAPESRELVWLVTLGEDHLRSCRYSLSALRETVTRVRPAWVLVDLPAGAVGLAQVQADAFQKEATVPTSALLREAPELFAAVLPLRHVLDYAVEGVSLRDTPELKAQAAYAAKWPDGPDSAAYAAAQAALEATLDADEPYFDQTEVLYSRAYLEAATGLALALDEAASSELGAAAPGVLLAGLEKQVREALARHQRGRGLLILNAAAMGYVLPRLAATEAVALVPALEYLPHLACDALPSETPAEASEASNAQAEVSGNAPSSNPRSSDEAAGNRSGAARPTPAQAGVEAKPTKLDRPAP